MAVKIMIQRQLKASSLKDASRLLIRSRYSAMEMPGYIPSETLSGVEDPDKVVVLSMWQNIDDWNRWRTSPVRSEFETELEKLMQGPAQIEAFNLGIQVEL